MKPRLIISALGASPPGTMGGNTKITIEMARCLAGSREVHVIVQEEKLKTFTSNLPQNHGIHIHTFLPYPGRDMFHPIRSTRWFIEHIRPILKDIKVGKEDFLFGCSDFHIDVLPFYVMQKEFGYRWLPSVFLFVPFVFENLARGYKFPAVKYIIYWFYQRFLFAVMKSRATGFVVTNESDFHYFPKRFDNKLFAYYGGVNTEQIPLHSSEHKKYDIVYCSRLHPQKGLDAFLDVWKEIVQKRPESKFAVIGNSVDHYDEYLKSKAERLGISGTIDWLGYVNNEAKFKIYAQSKLLAHTTVFDNNGMVAAEALCTGLPVVMQDIPALKNVYTAGCVKVPFGDKKAFADSILALISDPEKLSAVAPTPKQLAELRGHWKWEARAKEFDHWLDGIPSTTTSA